MASDLTLCRVGERTLLEVSMAACCTRLKRQGQMGALVIFLLNTIDGHWDATWQRLARDCHLPRAAEPTREHPCGSLNENGP